MKFRDRINALAPDTVVGFLAARCDVCDAFDVCAYDIGLNATICSDECREDLRQQAQAPAEKALRRRSS